MEAVIPLEIGLPTIRSELLETGQNDSLQARELDLAESRRELALIRAEAYKQQVARSFNKRVRTRTFQIGDLVLRRVLPNTKVVNDGKLGPNWEGPYRVASQSGQGAYRLEELNGKAIGRAWNTMNLRAFYH